MLFVERANELVLCCLDKPLCGVSAVKASLKGRFTPTPIFVILDCYENNIPRNTIMGIGVGARIARTRPEARRAIYEQGESRVISGGGPHPLAVQY